MGETTCLGGKTLEMYLSMLLFHGMFFNVPFLIVETLYVNVKQIKEKHLSEISLWMGHQICNTKSVLYLSMRNCNKQCL